MKKKWRGLLSVLAVALLCACIGPVDKTAAAAARAQSGAQVTSQPAQRSPGREPGSQEKGQNRCQIAISDGRYTVVYEH